MGKAGFIDIQDQSGRIQSYVRKDHLGDEEYEWFKKYDIGDIIGIKGEVFRTQKGQISVKADEVKLLSKSLLPLPEKMAWLEGYGTALPPAVCGFDCQSDVKKLFVMRSKFIRHMRNYLDERGYIEVETPVLNTIAGGAAARLYYPPQYAGFGYVYAYCNRAP